MKRSVGIVLVAFCLEGAAYAEPLKDLSAAPASAPLGLGVAAAVHGIPADHPAFAAVLHSSAQMPSSLSGSATQANARNYPTPQRRRPYSVSEPTTLLLMALGLLGGARFARRSGVRSL